MRKGRYPWTGRGLLEQVEVAVGLSIQIATGSAAAVPAASTIGSPFNVYLRSPPLAQQLREVGEYLRFKTSLPARLNEFAIMITARQWGTQYEWFAHSRRALKAELNLAVAEDLAHGKRPVGMQDDEAAVYNFAHELHTTRQVRRQLQGGARSLRRAWRGGSDRSDWLLRNGVDDTERRPHADAGRCQAAVADA